MEQSRTDKVLRHELSVKWPVRIVQTKDRPFFCATDLGKLFCMKKPYDAVRHYFKNAETKILIPCKQNPDYSRILCFLSERQTRMFVRKQLEKKIGKPIEDEWTIDVFISSLKQGKMPTALNPKVVPLTPEDAKKMEVPKGVNNLDLQTTMTLIKMYKQFVQDVRTFLNA